MSARLLRTEPRALTQIGGPTVRFICPLRYTVEQYKCSNRNVNTDNSTDTLRQIGPERPGSQRSISTEKMRWKKQYWFRDNGADRPETCIPSFKTSQALVPSGDKRLFFRVCSQSPGNKHGKGRDQYNKINTPKSVWTGHACGACEAISA